MLTFGMHDDVRNRFWPAEGLSEAFVLAYDAAAAALRRPERRLVEDAVAGILALGLNPQSSGRAWSPSRVLQTRLNELLLEVSV